MNNSISVGDAYNPYKLFTGSFIPNWILQRTDLSASDKLVWARLAQYAGESGKCYPSQELLAKECGLTKKTVNKSIKALCDKNLIKKKNPEGQERFNHRNCSYEFTYDECLLGLSAGVKKSYLGECKKVTSLYIRESCIRESLNTSSDISEKTKNPPNEKKEEPIHFKGDILQITERAHNKFKTTYPDINLTEVYKAMDDWLYFKKARKKNYDLFAHNWLKRSKTSDGTPNYSNEAEDPQRRVNLVNFDELNK